jgi:hypothetical protein
MTSLFSLLSFIDTPVNAHNFVSDVNDTESGLPMNRTLATFVLTTALNLEFGQVSHWAVVATKPGRIRMQVTLLLYVILGLRTCKKG